MPFFDWGDGNIVVDPDAKQSPMDFAHHLTAEMERLEIEPNVFLPKRGDVLIWHAYLAHGGTPIKNPELTRRSYVTHHAPLDSFPPLHMRPKAIEKGHCLQENGGFVFDPPWYKGGDELPSARELKPVKR
ncbi:MAG: hypothetical protein AB8F26_05965 [Phycisphaerales bacterium]